MPWHWPGRWMDRTSRKTAPAPPASRRWRRGRSGFAPCRAAQTPARPRPTDDVQVRGGGKGVVDQHDAADVGDQEEHGAWGYLSVWWTGYFRQVNWAKRGSEGDGLFASKPAPTLDRARQDNSVYCWSGLAREGRTSIIGFDPDHPKQPARLGPLMTQTQHLAPLRIVHPAPTGNLFHRALAPGANILLIQCANVYAGG